MKKWILALTLGLAAMAIGVLFHSPAKQKRNLAQDGVPWNGGKPRPPVWIEFDAGQASATPSIDCGGLIIRVRGVDGVTVENSDPSPKLPCVAQQKQSVSVSYQPPAVGDGLLVIDASLLIDGIWHDTTQAWPIKGKQPKDLSQQSTPVEIDKNGVRYHVFPAKRR